MNVEEFAYLITSFLLIATFIAVFFFTYVSSVEAEIVSQQITQTLEDFLTGANLVLTPDEKQEILNAIGGPIKAPDMSSSDANVSKTNSKLVKKSVIIFGILLSVGFILVVSLRYFYTFSITDILKYSLIILSLIMGTEILFVTLVTKNYRLIDPNFVTFTIIQNLKRYAGSKNSIS